LGSGISAEDLSDDCLGRALDWLYAHDPTTLFAGIALQARRRFGIGVRQVHVDTTSFSVSGVYTPEAPNRTATSVSGVYTPEAPNRTATSVSGVYTPEAPNRTATDSADAAEGDLDAHIVAITRGYSRDRRADLKQWMLALAATGANWT
jgi:hypothetical protein